TETHRQQADEAHQNPPSLLTQRPFHPRLKLSELCFDGGDVAFELEPQFSHVSLEFSLQFSYVSLHPFHGLSPDERRRATMLSISVNTLSIVDLTDLVRANEYACQLRAMQQPQHGELSQTLLMLSLTARLLQRFFLGAGMGTTEARHGATESRRSFLR